MSADPNQEKVSNANLARYQKRHPLKVDQLRKLFLYFAAQDGYLNLQDFERLCQGLHRTENSPAPDREFIAFAYEMVFGVDSTREAIDSSQFVQYFNYYFP